MGATVNIVESRAISRMDMGVIVAGCVRTQYNPCMGSTAPLVARSMFWLTYLIGTVAGLRVRPAKGHILRSCSSCGVQEVSIQKQKHQSTKYGNSTFLTFGYSEPLGGFVTL